MKKIFKVLGLFLIVILLMLILIPLLYQKEIKQKIEKAASEQINGKVTFGDVSVSLLKKFPRASVSIQDFQLISYATNDSSELFETDQLDLAFDFWNLFTLDKGIEIKSLQLNNPKINIYVDPSGKANFDISKSNQTETSTSTTLKLQLSDYKIISADITYKDDSSAILVLIKNMNHSGNGNFDENIVDLNTKTTIDSLSMSSGGIKYLNKVKVNSILDVTIDQSKNLYTLKKNNISLNALTLQLIGTTQLFDDGKINMDLQFNSPSNSFKDLFSLIPNAYTKDYNNVKANGNFKLLGSINGDFLSGKLYPSWDFNIDVNNAFLQYPDMPAALEDVNLHIESKNTGPKTTNQSLLINPLHFAVNKKSIDGNLSILQLETDPHISGKLKGDILLEDFAKFMPLEPGVTLSGSISNDIAFDFLQSQVQKNLYDEIKFEGKSNLSNIQYKDPTMPLVQIPTLDLSYSPKQISISDSKLLLGKSDLAISGFLSNPLALVVKNSETSGKIKLTSNKMDINEWTSSEESESETADNQSMLDLAHKLNIEIESTFGELNYDTYNLSNLTFNGKYAKDNLAMNQCQFQLNGDQLKLNGNIQDLMAYVYENKTLSGAITVESPNFNLTKFMGEEPATNEATAEEPFLVPENMDFKINFNIGKLIYDKLQLDKLRGNLVVSNNTIHINEMMSSALGGNMALNGIYNTADKNKPTFDLKYDLRSVQFPKALDQILSFKQLAPITKFIEGLFNSSFSAKGILGKNMMPDLSTLSASGLIETLNGAIKGYKPIEGLAEKLNIGELKTLNIQNTKNWFTIENGFVNIKEIDKKINDIDIKLGGKHKIQGDMDYNIKLKIPKNKWNQNIVGATAETGMNYIKNLATQAGVPIEIGSYVNVLINLTGKYDNPKINYKLLGSDGQSVEESSKEMIKEIGKKAEDSIRNRANQEIDKAKEKAMAEAKRIEDSLRIVANRKIEEAKKKALEKAAEEAKKHVDTALVNKGKVIIEDKLGKEAGKVLGEGGKKEVEKAKDKLKDWDPFKKKEKK